MIADAVTQNWKGQNARIWRTFRCTRCGGVVMARAMKSDAKMVVNALYPPMPAVEIEVPERARVFLEQAMESLHAPAGAVMLAASAVDAMLKDKGLKKGTLYERIDNAAKQHLITEEMAAWAHDIRLDANDQRHADETVPLPTESEARKCVDFAKALGEFLFVLPARVTRGRQAVQPS